MIPRAHGHALDPQSPAGRALVWAGRPFPRRIGVFGSTGTVGLGGLAVARAHPDHFIVEALAAGRNVRALAAQVAEFTPRLVVVADDAARDELCALTGLAREAVRVGPAGLAETAAEPLDVLLQAVAGAAGLPATLGAIEAGTPLALANKESLVLAGELVAARAQATDTPILPVDSEHAGLFQCLAGLARGRTIARLVLTASGGPLRGHADWADATPADVLAHPVWRMGDRITVDSALLLNKGFEVIEAHVLFGVPYDGIDVVIHPQAIVHALVDCVDHSTVAQLSVPDMKLPIQMALAWPARLAAPVPRLDLGALGRLEFEAVAPGRYPAFELARRAALAGGTAPAILNAADEVAVGAFLAGRIRLGDVPGLLALALDTCAADPVQTLPAIERADREAREVVAAELLRRHAVTALDGPR
ncbi:MAG: 1-deoxy-D-xylulose-5-phosphate reductoisomerase [Candidatus Eisenbacteria bacterium]